jgi:DNA repair photolyase
LDDEVRKEFEPNSSPVKEKLEAIKKLKENGIEVYVFFGPMLPYISDKNLEKFFQTMKELKVDYLMIDSLNLKSGIWKKLEIFLTKKYPELVPKWKDALTKKDYYEELKIKIKKLCKENKLRCDFCY